MTVNDPWANDEAQQAPAQDDPWGSPPPEAAKPAPAPVQNTVIGSDGKIVLTFKEAAGFDASWIVVHAGSVAEANEILDDHEAFKELMDKTKKVAAYYRGGAAPSAGGGGNRGGGRQGAPQGAKQPPPGTQPAPDSSYEYKSGTKNGRFWHAWMPPKGSNKEIVWLPDPS